MTRFRATIYVDGEVNIDGVAAHRVKQVADNKIVLKSGAFFCRDGMIPSIKGILYRLKDNNPHREFRAYSNNQHRLTFDLTRTDGSPYKRTPFWWDDIMGCNAGFSPIASPFLLRWYIGRIRNGYTYSALNNALRAASEQGVALNPNLFEAWNVHENARFNASGLGLGNILRSVHSWDFGGLDYNRIFPPTRFL